MAKDPMLQSLCSTSIWNALGLMPNTSNLINHVLQSLCSTKNIITHVIQSLCSTKNIITYVLQGLHITHYRTQSCIQYSAHCITIIISIYLFSNHTIINPVHCTMKIVFFHQGPHPTYIIIYKIIKHVHWITPNISKELT